VLKTAAPAAAAAPAPAGDGAEEPVVPPADRTTVPAGEAGWTALLTELYARRATAFTTADPEALTGAYLPGSPLLDRDTAAVRTLLEAGRTLTGFSPQVRRLLSVTPAGAGRVVLLVVDELPGYRVVPVGAPGAAPAQDVAGRGAAEVRIVLEQTTAGWRISDARVES
jgi:hypothetical protein